MSVIEMPQYYHTYYPSDGIMNLNDIPNIVTHNISAYKDLDGLPQSLTVGATSNLNIESALDVNVYLGKSNAYTLYTSEYSGGVRTDTEILKVDRNTSGSTTVISGPSNIQITSSDVANSTFTVGSLELSQDATAQIIDTAMNNFRFEKGMQVQGDVAIANNLITSGNIYGANMNIWLDTSNKTYDRIGYGLHINDKDQLEIVKYAKFTSNSVLKKVAVFGSGTPTLSDQSDAASYLVFDSLGNVSVASSNGSLNPVASTNASSGSDMTLSGTTTLSGDMIPSTNLAYQIGNSSRYLEAVYTSNVVFPGGSLIVNGASLLSTSVSSSSTTTAATSSALSNAYNLASAAQSDATTALSSASTAQSTATSAQSTAGAAQTVSLWASNNFTSYLPLSGGTVSGQLTIGGDLTVNGTTTTVNTQSLLVTDNIVSLNTSLSNGTPPSTLQSGIEVFRGSLPKYYFTFDESSTLFKVGLSNQLQAVTTRDDVLTNGFPYYDSTSSKLISRTIGLSNVWGGEATSNASFSASNQAYLWTKSGSNVYYSVSAADSNYLGVGFSNPQYKLAVNGQIYSSDDIIAFSDKRLKDNLEVIPNALEKVLSLSGYTYRRKDHANDSKRYAGVIAQEVSSVLPEVIHTDGQGFMSVAYGNMVALLIEAIKDLNAKVDKKLDAPSTS